MNAYEYYYGPSFSLFIWGHERCPREIRLINTAFRMMGSPISPIINGNKNDLFKMCHLFVILFNASKRMKRELLFKHFGFYPKPLRREISLTSHFHKISLQFAIHDETERSDNLGK